MSTYRIDRRFPGVGRIALYTGTHNRQTFRKYDALLTGLYETGRLDLLEAIRNRELTLRQVYDAKRRDRLPHLAADISLQKKLWQAVDEWIPNSAAAPSSRRRYEGSWNRLRNTGVLSDDATVAELARVDWITLSTQWPGGAADWNRMRAGVSRFLSVTLGDKWHPFRRQVLDPDKSFPRKKESPGRVPDLPPELFWKIVDAAPEYLRASYVAMAVAGLRPGEYLALEGHHLLPHTKSIQVPGSKTAGSADVVRVGPIAWDWVKAAVPSPVQYRALYDNWKAACRSQGAGSLTLHDLRHFYGQQLTEAGRPEVSVQSGLRHATPAMTRRYARMKDVGLNAAEMDRILFGS